MSNDPLISVCVPTIGRLRYLGEARAALETQTRTDFELLVLDNASPDDSRALIVEWAARDPRVQHLRSDARLPMFENFNRGVAAARGQYVTFCHDDDIVMPRFLEAMVGMLEKHPNTGIAGSNFDFIDETGRITERRRWIPRTEVWEGRRYVAELIRRGRNPIAMPGLIFRREALAERGFDLGLSLHWGDFVILMRIAEKYDLAMSHDSLVRIRRHESQASQAIPFSRSIPMRTEMMRAYCAEYRQRWPKERSFVDELEKSNARAHRLGLLWAWASAKDENEANASLDGFADGPLDRSLVRILRGVDRAGLGPSRRMRVVRDVGRALSGKLGI